MMKSRQLTLAAASYQAREEMFDGRPHLVVPVIALVEGVIQAMNSPTPELVTAKEYTRPGVVGGFNGRPIYEGHPVVNGEPVSGNTPELIEEKCIGRVFHACVKSMKLAMEAWIDVEKAEAVAPDLLERIAAGDPIEISVGVFCETGDETGEYDGKKYEGSWTDIVPDHLALLTAGDRGACSNKMGCGVRAAKGDETVKDSMYAEWLDLEGADEVFLTTLRAARNIPQSERDKMPAEDFAGPNRSFPIAEPGDVSAAASSLGRAKGNKDAIKRKIIAIAYRKGAEYVAKLPEDWKKKKDQKNASAFSRLMDAARGMFRSAEVTVDESDNDVRRELTDALKAMEPGLICVEDVYSDRVIYTSSEGSMGYPGGYGYACYQRAYSKGAGDDYVVDGNRVEVERVYYWEPVTPDLTVAAGKRHSAKDQKMVQSMHDQAVTLGADCGYGKSAKNAGAGAPCSCGGHAPQENIDMKKEELVKFLETATPEQITALSAVAEGKAPEAKVETPAVAAAVIETKVETPAVAAAAAKTPTFEEILATAEPSVRDAIAEGQRVGADKRATTVKALKDTGRCDMTDKELAALSQAQLDQLVKLAGAPKTDFSVAGASRAQENANEIPAAPDLTAALKAAQKK